MIQQCFYKYEKEESEDKITLYYRCECCHQENKITLSYKALERYNRGALAEEVFNDKEDIEIIKHHICKDCQ